MLSVQRLVVPTSSLCDKRAGPAMALDDAMDKAAWASYAKFLLEIYQASRGVVECELRDGAVDETEDPSSIRAPPGLVKQPPSLPEHVVTLMVRNIPSRYHKDSLIAEWKPFVGSFDFLHLPIDPETRVSKGYCFINFISPEAARAFQLKNDRTRLKFQKGKPLNISVASVQGLQGNLEILRQRKSLPEYTPEMLPALFIGQERMGVEGVLRVLRNRAPSEKLRRLAEGRVKPMATGNYQGKVFAFSC